MDQPRTDVARLLLTVLTLVGLLGSAFWVVTPFLPSFLWAVMIAVATWPALLAVQRLCRGSRGAAVTLMTLVLLLVFVVPLGFAIDAMVGSAGTASDWLKGLGDWTFPPPPDWIRRWPLGGTTIAAAWEKLAALSHDELAARVAPQASAVLKWAATKVSSFGFLFIEFILTVLITALLYAQGEAVANFFLEFARRLAGQRGDEAVRLAGNAIRGVALGVVGTALIQAAFCALGLAIAGVPFVALLAAACFLLAVAQLGVIFVMVPAIAWLFLKDATAMAWFLIVVTLIAQVADNVIRPILIKKGADLPIVLIIAGVIGGLIAYGLIGLFIGPVVLAVGWTLLEAWVHDKEGSHDSFGKKAT